jgi:hypothetical protein
MRKITLEYFLLLAVVVGMTLSFKSCAFQSETHQLIADPQPSAE